jgi:hypothetical protein
MRGASPPQRTAGASRCTPRAPGAQTIDPGQLHCHQHGQPVSSAYHLRLPTPRRHATHTRPAHASHTRASHTRASHTHAHACASHTTPPCLPACSKKKKSGARKARVVFFKALGTHCGSAPAGNRRLLGVYVSTLAVFPGPPTCLLVTRFQPSLPWQFFHCVHLCKVDHCTDTGRSAKPDTFWTHFGRPKRVRICAPLQRSAYSDTLWTRFGRPKRVRIRPKRVRIRLFGHILDTFWTHFWTHFVSQSRLRIVQKVSGCRTPFGHCLDKGSLRE